MPRLEEVSRMAIDGIVNGGYISAVEMATQ
jgi:hypothetical protein